MGQKQSTASALHIPKVAAAMSRPVPAPNTTSLACSTSTTPPASSLDAHTKAVPGCEATGADTTPDLGPKRSSTQTSLISQFHLETPRNSSIERFNDLIHVIDANKDLDYADRSVAELCQHVEDFSKGIPARDVDVRRYAIDVYYQAIRSDWADAVAVDDVKGMVKAIHDLRPFPANDPFPYLVKVDGIWSRYLQEAVHEVTAKVEAGQYEKYEWTRVGSHFQARARFHVIEHRAALKEKAHWAFVAQQEKARDAWELEMGERKAAMSAKAVKRA